MGAPPVVWGLDVSKRRTGLAFGAAGETPKLVSIAAREDDETARVGVRLFVYLRDLLKVARPDFIFYERMLEHGFAATIDAHGEIKQRKGIIAAMDLARLTHTVELIAGLASIPVRNVAPSTARKEFLGDGRLDRKTAKRRAIAMCKLLGWNAENDDEADAACIWHWGICQTAPNLAAAIHGGLHAKAATAADGRAKTASLELLR